MGEPREPTTEPAVATDGGTTTRATATADADADDEDVGGLSAPTEDEEMPLADHIEEMIKRLAIVIVVAGSISIVVFPLADQLINFLWYSILPNSEVTQPRVYGPLEFVLARIKVASLAGLIVALPVVVYQAYRFMRPGLYKNERKYYLAAVPTSLVLAVVGVLFAYFVVLPAIFTYFLTYSQEAGEIAFALSSTFDLILILMAYLAIVFQIPLMIMLAIMMGLTTRRWLTERRLYFWGGFLGVAFISSPDPTGMAPIIIALTMVGLFEGTLLILKWVGR
ncbi:twin-arginine translocase subunit TatC [Halalkalicoccus ordinarius]|uniref:twin-arginine translocase subunit TatC n=1 Tax=Halalkalicoccus ordinarius TaxID=3116651 RepID=UPI00300F567A